MASMRSNWPRTSSRSRPGRGRTGHVFTLHAELEGMRLAGVFESLLAGWRAQGWKLVSMRTLFESVQALPIPRCLTGPGTVPGRSGTLLVQGREFLGDIAPARAA